MIYTAVWGGIFHTLLPGVHFYLGGPGPMSGRGRGAQRVTAGASNVAHRRWNSVFRLRWYIFLRGGRGFHIAVYTSRRASEQAKQP